MRFAKSLFLVLFAVALVFSCTTVDTAGINKLDSVALISVFCDKNIGYSNFTKNVSAIGLINGLANAKDFDLSTQASSLRDQLFSEYASRFPFKLLEEASVLSNEGYKALVAETSKSGIFMSMNVPQGYSAYYPNTIGGKIGIKDFAAALPAASGFMMAVLRYELVKTGIAIAGFGNAVIRASLEIKIVDREGKTMMYVMKTADSDTKVPYVLGDIIDTKVLPQAVADASAKVRKIMLDFLAKNL